MELKIRKLFAYFAGISLALSGCSRSPSISTPDDPSETEGTSEKVEAYLESMSLEEKIEQMLVPSLNDWYTGAVTTMNDELSSVLNEYHFGGLILFANNFTEDASQTIQLTQALQESTINGGGAPLFIGVDQEGGIVNRVTAGILMTSSMALAATGDPANAKQAAEMIAAELYDLGINADFAPDLDVNSNPANPVIGTRAYSDDANTVATYSSAFLEGMEEKQIIAAGKHFPGHGDTDTDSHTGLPLVDKTKEQLENEDLVPFQQAVANGIPMIMSAHIQYPQIETETYTSLLDGSEIYLPSTLSHTMITDILRNELGFEGVVITDSLQMSAIADHFTTQDTARLAINAGVDMLLMPFSITSGDTSFIDAYIQDIVDMVNAGEIQEETINEAVKRILTLKYEYGIMDTTYGEDHTNALLASAANEVGCAEFQLANRDIADHAVTVLKKDLDVVANPLSVGEKVVCIGEDTDQQAALTFGMNRLIQEGYVDQDVVLEYESLDYGDRLDACLNRINGASMVIVCSLMTSALQIDFSQSTILSAATSLIAQAKSQGIPVIAVSTNLPYDVPLLQEADTILCVYNYVGLPDYDDMSNPIGAYSESIPAALDIVFGKSQASGTVPVNIPDIDSGTFSDAILYPRGSGITN